MKGWRFGLIDCIVTALQFLVGYTDLLIVWSGIFLWEAFAGKPLSIEIKWSLYLGAFLATSFWNWRKQLLRARAAEASLVAEKKQSTPVRTFVEDAEVFLRRYGQSGTHSEKLLVPHLDKWIQVSGSFEGAADSLVGMRLSYRSFWKMAGGSNSVFLTTAVIRCVSCEKGSKSRLPARYGTAMEPAFLFWTIAN